MSADQLLDALDPDQRAVATALQGPVCVLAGAGTGKTRAITHRIAYGVQTGTYSPTSVLAVTFTARAAGEMRTRLRDLGVAGVQARTFHSAALRQLGYFWPKAVGGAVPRLVEHKARLVAEAASRIGLATDRLTVRDLASEIEWSKVSLVPAEDYAAAITAEGRPTPAGQDAATVARLLTSYEDVKTDHGVIDFEDVLLVLAGILQARPDIADEVRRQYRHFVVDEYQDVSPLQQHLLDQWLGGRHELCVVGDPSQTIYSFTGATPYHLLTFTQKHPGAEVVRLVRDYRSTPQVVDLANRTLRAAGRDQVGGLELVAQRPPGPPVGLTAYDDDEDEAAGVAARIGRLVRAGTPAREIAVLYRTNAQSEAFEQALADAGIGYLVRGGERFFSRKEVRDAVLLLRGAARSMADAPLGDAVRDVLATAGWTPEPPAARGAVRERWDSLQALVALADDLAATPGSGLPALVAELDERAAAQHAPAVDGVTLASLHAAKGLEWDAVFLTGLSEGLLPISLAETDAAVAEERRLLYVGITRAREHLELSYARARNPGGRSNRRRTRFLDRIWPDDGSSPRRGTRTGADVRSPAGRGLGRTSVATVDPDDADPALYEALREWRRATAEERGTAPSMVLSERTLRGLAASAPTTAAELARVPGMGQTRSTAYGESLLAVVEAHRRGRASSGR
ncbi:ATP-dependent DNA helicase UvrD2 [Actinotalea sp. AC32]|nr:ATP-dependent DNA helicase UvrD2 [Actinotalea sp. AC32]